MGYAKELSGIDFMVESKIWTEAKKEEMRMLIVREKKEIVNKKNKYF